MNAPNRRLSNSKANDIESMIAEENEPKQRAFLIILNSINNSLMANTNTTSDVAIKLDEHLSRFEAKSAADAELLNQGRGAWKILAWVLGVAQIGVLAACTSVISDLKEIHHIIERLEPRVVNLEKSDAHNAVPRAK